MRFRPQLFPAWFRARGAALDDGDGLGCFHPQLIPAGLGSDGAGGRIG
jgi:hypothetical protein